MLATIILAAALFLSPVESPYYAHVTQFLENYLKTTESVPNADTFLASQQEDGTWTDIDYKSQLLGAWPCAIHASRYKILASAYHQTGEKKYLDGARKALKYWMVNKPVSDNWWYNQIGIPEQFGPASVLIMGSLSKEEINGVVEILSKARFGMTGQNKIWQAEGVLARAYLQGDMKLVKEARDQIVSEIVVSPWKEGIQPDWSFHQHGPQLQWGNYGLSYASEMSWVVQLFDGTPLAVAGEQRKIIENYIVEGLSAVLWKGNFDMNACGRQIWADSQTTKAKSVFASLDRLGLKPVEFTGGRYFPYADYGIYRTDDWTASLRMQSSRTKGMEHTILDNMRGRYGSDGALLLRKSGDEYYDVAVTWDWHHVPGVTCPDDGQPIYGWEETARYNITPKVFGETRDELMVCAMDLNRDGLTARKAWFFWPGGILCLGSGITYDGDAKVVTGVEQCRISGDVAGKKRWIRHNGVTYVPLDGKFITAPREHSGDWYSIHPTKEAETREIITDDLLDIYIDHGNSPKGETYAYVTVPVSRRGASARKMVRKTVKIISNTAQEQCVTIAGRKIRILWDEGKIEF